MTEPSQSFHRTLAPSRRRRFAALLSVVGIVAALSAGGTDAALADSSTPGGDVSVAQSLGDRELTVIIRRVTSVPGPVHIDVVTHTGSPAGFIDVQVVPTGTGTLHDTALVAPGMPTDQASIALDQEPGAYGAAVDLDRTGPWELVVDDGQFTGRIPFVVTAHPPSPAESVAYVGIIAAGVLLLVAGGVALTSRRRWVVMVPALAAVISMGAAATGAALSATTPTPPQPGYTVGATTDNVDDPYRDIRLPADVSRPPVNMVVQGWATAGAKSVLDFSFLDGATGAAVDDLLIHDGALVHLLIVSPTGELTHVHPVRTAPGLYRVQVLMPNEGTYAASAEVSRRGGGVQLVRASASISVTSSPSSALPRAAAQQPLALSSAQPSGNIQVDGHDIEVTTSNLTAGAVSSIEVVTGKENDLQLWLGMMGHLIIAGPLNPSAGDVAAAVQASPAWSHAHSMGSMQATAPTDQTSSPPDPTTPPSSGHGHGMAPIPRGDVDDHMAGGSSTMVMTPTNGDSPPDETVAAYGPVIPYTFSFALPGTYRVWVQFERDFRIVTVPLRFEVADPHEVTK